MFESIDRLIEFGVQIGVIVTLIGGLAAWLKRSVNKGMVTQEAFDTAILKVKVDYEEYVAEKIADHKEITEKADKADKKWLRDIQGKFETMSNQIFKIAGKVGVDL